MPVRNKDSLDKVMHLMSVMQFTGFHSVIGTMWMVDDAQMNKITSVFYDNIIDKHGHLNYTCATLVLNRMMKEVDVTFNQHILYVHCSA
ncbi:hypothetical protein J3R82DRAFT_9900 [Butyriboletus roseoflavus]|nr:hypothetical protein J3R82DRAFT_9900 [Butyriboletus roseoflavus]